MELARLHEQLKKREREEAQIRDKLHNSKQMEEALKMQIQTSTDETNNLCTTEINGISNRRKNMPESKFIERCLERVKENSVEIEEVVRVLTKSRNVLKSSAVTCSFRKTLISNNLETWFLQQLEKPPPEETRNPLEDKFEDRLMKILRGLSNYAIFRNILDNIKQEINVNK